MTTTEQTRRGGHRPRGRPPRHAAGPRRRPRGHRRAAGPAHRAGHRHHGHPSDDEAPLPERLRSALGSGDRKGVGLDRRRFFLTSGAAAGAAVVTGGAGRLLLRRSDVDGARADLVLPAPASPAAPLPVGADLAPQVQGRTPLSTSNREFHRVDTSITVPQIRPAGRYRALARDPPGAPLRETGIQSGSDQLVCRSSDGRTTGAPAAGAAPPRSPGQGQGPSTTTKEIHVERTLTRTALLAGVSALALSITACGAEDTASDAAGSAGGAASSASEDAMGGSSSAPSDSGTSSAEPFGEGCAAVLADGEGSFAGMTDDPVATAASNNPVLSTLVQVVVQANLVDTLNSAQDVTVIAPANPAFEAVPPDALRAVLADDARLTAILSHHVIEGRLAPDELAGTHATLGGDEVTIEGSGESFTVARTVTGTPASVICGNVQTANATVYVVDQVLAPALG
ncbi:fasciclin domain-containing protein [Geodermatophilus sp. SYSU D00779]